MNINKPTEMFYSAVAIVTWLAGIVLAKGGTATMIACVFPLYAWYLVIERIMLRLGWLA